MSKIKFTISNIFKEADMYFEKEEMGKVSLVWKPKGFLLYLNSVDYEPFLEIKSGIPINEG